MADPADDEGGGGPSETVTPVAVDLGPSQGTGDPNAGTNNEMRDGTNGVWKGSHPTIQAAVEDAAHYRNLLPKYKDCFKGRDIRPHPDDWVIMRRVVTMVIHDINQGRLTSVDKDILASALNSCGVKPLLIHKSNFANYDILMETEEKAKEAAACIHRSKSYRMEPMYMGRRHTTLFIYNAPASITRECLGTYFSQFGDVESVTAGRLKSGVMSANYKICMKTTTKAYEDIPDYLTCHGQEITVVVEGRKGHCFNCRQQGHLARDCPLKKQQQQQQQKQQQQQPAKSYAKATTSTAPVAPVPTTPAPAPGTPIPKAPAVTSPLPAPADGDNQVPDGTEDSNEGFWSLATGKGCKSHKQYTPPASPRKPAAPRQKEPKGRQSPKNTTPPTSPAKARPAAPKGYIAKTAALVSLQSTKKPTAPMEVTTRDNTKADPKANKRRAASSEDEAAPKPTKVERKKKKPSKSQPVPAPASCDGEDPQKPVAPKSLSTPSSKSTPEPPEAPAINYTAPPQTPVQDLPTPDISMSTPSTPVTETPDPYTVEYTSQDPPTPATPVSQPITPTSTPATAHPTTPPPLPPTSAPNSPHKSRPESKPHSRARSSSSRRKAFKEGVDCLQVGEETFEKLSGPMKKIYTSLRKCHMFNKKNCEDPRNFPHARLVMTLIHSSGRTRAWDLIDHAKKVFPKIKMVDSSNENLRSVRNKVSGRVPILVHPSLYRALKLTYPSEVGVVVRDGYVPHDHGHGNLGLYVGRLTLEDFEPTSDKQ